MWEIILANKRKSWIIFIGMGACLILLGYFVGTVWLGPDGGVSGIFIALCIWIVLSVISYAAGDSLVLAFSGAKEVSHEVHPQLFNIVEEMKIAANLPAMPKVYIIDEAIPNAFATGRSPQKSAIAVTAGLLSKLNRDELQGVIAHEMSHILNRDVLYVTFAGVMLGSIAMLSEVFLRSLWYRGSSRRYRSSSSLKGSGQAQVIIMVVAIVLAILAPILARLFYFALSRKREYLADASAVRLTRYPEGLASALERISGTGGKFASANKITSPMYIINPLRTNRGSSTNLFSTHPPTSERVNILRSMSQGASYTDYQMAFLQVKTGVTSGMPPSALRDFDTVAIRKPTASERKEQSSKEKTRDLGDLMRAVNQYVFLMCVCGLKIKVPPDFKKDRVSCPRCSREHEIPLTDFKTAAVLVGATATQEGNKAKRGQESRRFEPQVYARKSEDWESFSCSCGKLLQLSPLFMGEHITCNSCKSIVKIKNKP